MALRSNGKLLLRHPNAPAMAAMLAPAHLLPGQLAGGYSLAPLRPVPPMPGAPPPQWHIATPSQPLQTNPWDAAHHAAQATGYAAYVEPDLLHGPQSQPAPLALAAAVAAAAPAATPAAPKSAPASPGGPITPEKGLQAAYPPTKPLSPAWHLGQDFTGFANMRDAATGAGIRIAHIDTGYAPHHNSTPRNMAPALGWDFWSNQQSTVDPGDDVFYLHLMQPGHGTATLALLAGTTVNLQFGDDTYHGDIGGAPDAMIVPVRVGPTVFHFYSSAMAKALDWVLAPAGRADMKCHVVSLSHGGLPSQQWADAVNQLYEAGVVVVAASGDWYKEGPLDLPTHLTVYPSAFNRVITAIGATYDFAYYGTTQDSTMQGSWGPDPVMEKAAAAFTPNVAWMDFQTPAGYSMDGGGTSASTPQIAAACALWMQLYAGRFAADWRVVEACRVALFRSCDAPRPGQDRAHLGWGTLNVPAMLSPALADAIEADMQAGKIGQSSTDSVSFPFWRELLGVAPDDSAREAMYETEVAQIVLSSGSPTLLDAAENTANGTHMDAATRQTLIQALLAEPVSAALAARLRGM